MGSFATPLYIFLSFSIASSLIKSSLIPYFLYRAHRPVRKLRSLWAWAGMLWWPKSLNLSFQISTSSSESMWTSSFRFKNPVVTRAKCVAYPSCSASKILIFKPRTRALILKLNPPSARAFSPFTQSFVVRYFRWEVLSHWHSSDWGSPTKKWSSEI